MEDIVVCLKAIREESRFTEEESSSGLGDKLSRIERLADKLLESMGE